MLVKDFLNTHQIITDIRILQIVAIHCATFPVSIYITPKLIANLEQTMTAAAVRVFWCFNRRIETGQSLCDARKDMNLILRYVLFVAKLPCQFASIEYFSSAFSFLCGCFFAAG